MANECDKTIIGQIVGFILSIGLKVVPTTIEIDTFLPGILVENGQILFDESRLTYPGDLLHEAGHLAIAPPNIRAELSDEVVVPGTQMEPGESGVMAWSYAAILHLGLAPEIVFHSGGYRGASQSLLFSYSLGFYPGVNILQDAGLTAAGEKAVELGVAPFPQMIKWVRD